ncbi:MAG TPA: TIGR02710 family CRISPR-associated CARF protein [Terriglobia bacterium]|nr:TIGR02710 family CRISPR-associated CARF protein [Terriglobia bacterium]
MNFRGVVISVGGSAEPVLKSLQHHQPEAVLFFVSSDSRSEVEEKILPALDRVLQYSFAETENPGDLAVCYEALRNKIPGWLSDRALQPQEVLVDITGGTKPMSAALALAGAELFSQFSYITGKERDKAGLGTVISGTEFVLFTSNPWDKLATRERDRSKWLFSESHAGAASRILLQAADKCSPSLRERLRTLGDLARLFAESDLFRFDNLQNEFNRIKPKLELIFSEDFSAFERLRALAMHWSEVQQEKNLKGKQVSATLLELLANAERRAKQGRYDDAIARLYRAAELFVQGELNRAFQAHLGKVKLENVPSEHREECQRRFKSIRGQEDVCLLGIETGFEALRFSPHPEQHEIAGRYDKLKNHLQKRNGSILAHGLRPASQEDFEWLWQSLLPIVGVADDTVPRWPKLDF